MALEILQTSSNTRDYDWVSHWVEASCTHLFWKSVEQAHLTCLGAGIWEQQISHFMAQYGSVMELHLREWGQPSQCSKIQTIANPSQGLTRETQGSWEIFGTQSMNFHSDINSLLTIYPSFPHSRGAKGSREQKGQLRGPKSRKDTFHFHLRVPSHLAHINLSSSFTWGGGRRPSWTKGNRAAICQRPHMASGTLEGGQSKRVASNQGQLRRPNAYLSSRAGPWLQEYYIYYGAGDNLNHQMY